MNVQSTTVNARHSNIVLNSVENEITEAKISNRIHTYPSIKLKEVEPYNT